MQPNTRLKRAFLQDHKVVIKGLKGIQEALQAGDLKEALRLAKSVDRDAGPHIAFEEEHFYPHLRPTLGDEIVEKLYDEHAEGREAIRELLALPPGEQPDPATVERIKAGLETMLIHAFGCGSLLSHLDRLDDGEQAELLGQLMEAREKGCPWRDRPRERAV